jgi:hypothetical protein
MSSRGFAHLEPLASDLVCRTLTMFLDHLPSEGPLQPKRTPWAVCWDVLGMQLEQQQIGHDRHGHRALDTIDFFGDLMLAQTDHTFEFLATYRFVLVTRRPDSRARAVADCLPSAEGSFAATVMGFLTPAAIVELQTYQKPSRRCYAV